jgi:SAM-dependent methyltransferase
MKDFTKLDDFVVYNTETRGAIHETLSSVKNYICSEYLGGSYKSGDIVNNIMHQDLMELSLSNESIDLVLSSDVFEHIPDPYKAHEEVYRVLKKGGRHVFTVPFYQTEFLDEDRAIIDSNGNTVSLKEPVYHGDPVRLEGTLVYKIFSLEMLVKLQRIGFRTNLYHLYKPLYGILGQNAIVFEAIKSE